MHTAELGASVLFPMKEEAHDEVDELVDRRVTAVEFLLKVLDEQGGAFTVTQTDAGDWVVGMFFGREAEDSNMVGGAAHGMADTMAAAIEQAAEQTGWRRPEPPVMRRLVCYNVNGGESVSWQMHVPVVTLADAPAEADYAISSAFLVVAEDERGKTILKSRDVLSNEGVDVDALLHELRTHPVRSVTPDHLAGGPDHFDGD